MQVEHDERTTIGECVQPVTKLNVEVVVESRNVRFSRRHDLSATRLAFKRVIGLGLVVLRPDARRDDRGCHDPGPADRGQVVGEGILFS
jgi:hypothetical protein